MRATSLFVTAGLICVVAILAAQTFPKPTGRVNDFADIIDASTEAQLDRQLDALERQTSSEIAVATVSSLEGTTIEDYANRLFKEWGVGQAKQDNGVLVVVAPNERTMRIEVGYGLEGVLPDGLCGQIIRDDFTPRFKENDYAGGIAAGVTHLVQLVEKHQVLTPEEIEKINKSNNAWQNAPFYVVVPFFGLFVTIGFGMLGLGVRSKTVFPILFGSCFGGMPLLMSLAFNPTASFYVLIPWAAFVVIAGYRLGARPGWRNAFRNSGSSGSSSSGWVMGASSRSGSSSSGSSSSSSSSFGGGSSGGGGASGSW